MLRTVVVFVSVWWASISKRGKFCRSKEIVTIDDRADHKIWNDALKSGSVGVMANVVPLGTTRMILIFY
jgi:hypothetical protein